MGKDRVIYQLYRADLSSTYDCGYDCMLTYPLLEQDSFDKNEVEQVILDDILGRIPNEIYERYPEIRFYDVMNVIIGMSDRFSLVDVDEDGDENVLWEAYIDNKNDGSTEVVVEYRYYNVKSIYYVEEIMNPNYYVIDVLGAPGHGDLCIELILAGPFEKRADAEVALKTVTKHPYDDYNQTVQVYPVGANLSESAKNWLEACTEILELENRLDTIEERDYLFRYRKDYDLIGSYLKKLRQHFGLEPQEESIVDDED